MRRGLVSLGPLLATAALTWPVAAHAAARRPDDIVTVAPAAQSRPIEPGFVGLSLEYRTLEAYTGTDPGAINPVLVQLIRNLLPGQALVLRIGGDSTDWTWWPVRGMRQPPGIRYALTPAWLAVTRSLTESLRARLILGINLEADSSRVAGVEARALLSGIGRRYVDALELGNEPELYAPLPWYRTSTGRGVPGRPASYGPQAFTNEVSNVRRSLPPVPLAGPSTGNFWWLAALPQFLAAEPAVGLVTFHRYALNSCATPGSSTAPTVPHLLASSATRGLLDEALPYIALAHRDGVPFRVDEMNSVTCGGRWGVSNTFAAALWTLDAMFVNAQAGVDGVNIHTTPFPGAPNELFSFRRQAGQWLGSVRPDYYGLLMFTHAAPPGSRLLGITVRGNPQVHSWATRARDRTIRIVLINDSIRHPHSVLLRRPRRSTAATLEWLTAPSAYATGGVTLAGQSFGPQTATGELSGAESTTPVMASSGGYAITLPPASAVMLTMPA